MNKSFLALSLAISMALFGASLANAADLRIINADGPGEGYNDATAAAPVGGNPGTTLGEQRQLVALFAADLWGAVLQSDVPIYIQAQFNPLAANVLGSAGATTSFANFAGAPRTNTWFQSALADSISGRDLILDVYGPGYENYPDIVTQFSSNFAFYFGLDDNTPVGTNNFLDVIMHEYAHGLGFANLANEATGTFSQGIPDIYSVYTFDNTTGKFWPQMTIAERRASAINDGNVVFTGANATAGAQLILDPLTLLRVTAPGPLAGNYTFGAGSFGPAPTSANFNGQVVLATDASDAAGPSTTDGCTAITNAAAIAGKVALMDRGTCGFTIKVKNAQNAGAIAVIIADNAAGQPAGLGGADPTITIPSVRISRADGILFKANLPATVAGFVVDPTRLTGADALGRPQLFMPPVVQSGSSGSHYDSYASPDLLMEPAINSSLFAAMTLDITPALFKDIGWEINEGNAKIDGCDTGIKVIDDGGIIVGANVQATSNVCLRGATKRGDYLGCMDTYKERLLAATLITGKQAGKMMACAARLGKAN